MSQSKPFKMVRIQAKTSGQMKSKTRKKRRGRKGKFSAMGALQTAIRIALTAYYLGGSIKLGIVVYEQTRSILLAVIGSSLLLMVSMHALFDLRVYPKSREAILWVLKVFVAYLYTVHLRAADPYVCFALLVLIDALAHLLADRLR